MADTLKLAVAFNAALSERGGARGARARWRDAYRSARLCVKDLPAGARLTSADCAVGSVDVSFTAVLPGLVESVRLRGSLLVV